MTVDFDAADVEAEEVAMAAAVEAAVQNSVSAMSSMIVRPHLVAETVVAEVETLVVVVVSLASLKQPEATYPQKVGHSDPASSDAVPPVYDSFAIDSPPFSFVPYTIVMPPSMAVVSPAL